MKGESAMKKIILDREYEEILYQYSDMITRICILNLRNSDDAKDCFQNTFIKLLKTDTVFHDKNHLKAWLIKVCINECKHYRLKFYSHTMNIDDVMIVKENQELKLLPEVLKLPKNYKNILYLYYYEGYHINEISQMLQINENTVKTYLRRGRDLLRKRIGEHNERF